jgi:hypothetical protein
MEKPDEGSGAGTIAPEGEAVAGHRGRVPNAYGGLARLPTTSDTLDPVLTMHRPEPPLPTFLIIGAQKSATRWLRANLGAHPAIYTADFEVAFFNEPRRVRRQGVDWYRQQFAGWEGEPVVGEATPGYMVPRHEPQLVARRIDRMLPDVRLIALLRNPVERAHSALVHHARRNRVPRKARLIDLVGRGDPEIDRLELIEAGRYAESLRPYRNRFRNRLLVMLHDDVVADPALVYRRALMHVGADPDFVPAELDRVVFSNRTAEDDRDLTADERRELYAYFRDDIAELSKLLMRDLSIWDPDHEQARQREPNASSA